MIRRVARHSVAMAGEYGSLLSRRISGALLAALAVLWVSGVIWLLLHYLLAKPGEFGVIRHPFEAPVLLLHGVVAMLALFLLGWFAGRHAGAASSGRRVASGWLLTVLTGVLVVAGCAQLFLTSAVWQSATAVLHEVLGVALLVPVLAHGRRASATSRAREVPHDGRAAPHQGERHARARRHSARS